MRCPKCDTTIQKSYKHCPHCGLSFQNYYKKNKRLAILGFVSSFLCCILFFLVFSLNAKETSYFFRENQLEMKENRIPLSDSLCQLETGTVSNSGGTVTAIISDNTYECEQINSEDLAIELIQEDSTSQKSICPLEIQKVENELIEKYGITAVNLCEMDVGFAQELEKVFAKIYEEYPSTRGYLTNITLKNESLTRSGVIASFLPIFTFANIHSSQYQLVIKTQMFLSSSYFLNPERLKSSTSDASNSGHFPPNASIYSPVAHEMGHYLSFIALLKSYDVDSILLIDSNHYHLLSQIGVASKSGEFAKQLLEEAYQQYIQDTSDTIDFDTWRSTISEYAVARDNGGQYIYDETIAEAFHDVYLNGSNAKAASQYIVTILKRRLS